MLSLSICRMFLMYISDMFLILKVSILLLFVASSFASLHPIFDFLLNLNNVARIIPLLSIFQIQENEAAANFGTLDTSSEVDQVGSWNV